MSFAPALQTFPAESLPVTAGPAFKNVIICVHQGHIGKTHCKNEEGNPFAHLTISTVSSSFTHNTAK